VAVRNRAPWRPRGDPQPASQVRVVLASAGHAFPEQVIAEAARLAADGADPPGPSGDGPAVAVVTVARIHGSAFGLQNPGLLPTRREREEQQEIVSAAIRSLRRRGLAADGQVVVTRGPGKAIARIARLRSASYVVTERAPGGWLRRLLEGDHVAVLRRRLPPGALIVEAGDGATMR
jgi:hypothetical protein